MQYAKKAEYHMGTKYTMGIRGRMGNPISEKESLGLPGVFVHYMVQNVLAIRCNQSEYTPTKTKWRICK